MYSMTCLREKTGNGTGMGPGGVCHGGGSQVTLPGVGTGGIQLVGWYAGGNGVEEEKEEKRNEG